MRTGDGRALSANERIALTPLRPNRARADAVRLRCRSELARRARHAGVPAIPLTPLTGRLVTAMLCAVSAFYVVAFVSAAADLGW
jgi:hypothetical protein